jgi:hypothetical protein
MKAESDAMGADEYHPISHDGSNIAAAGGIGYTVVGALDTMLLMGLDAEYVRARDWIEKELTFDRDAEFNTLGVRLFFCDVFALGDLNVRLGLHSLWVPTYRLRSACLAAFFLHTTTPGATPFT